MASYSGSAKYSNLAASSRHNYNICINTICDYFKRDTDITRITHQDVLDFQYDLADTPGKANLTLRVLCILFNHAMKIGAITANPAANVGKLNGGTWLPWPRDALRIFSEGAHGTARHGFFLCLYTGQRIGDVRKMRWDDMNPDGTAIAVTHQKTGIEVVVPLHSKLLAEMRDWPHDTEWLVPRYTGFDHATQHDKNTWYRAFENEKTRLGLTDLQIHGLRKNAMIMLSEAGCSDREIMAMMGLKTVAMVTHYTAKAERSRMARSAMAKWEAATS